MMGLMRFIERRGRRAGRRYWVERRGCYFCMHSAIPMPICLCRDACVFCAVERGEMRCTVLGLTSNLAAVLRKLMGAPRQNCASHFSGRSRPCEAAVGNVTGEEVLIV
jgi:hypothetical protein